MQLFFSYNKPFFHLKDIIKGKVVFTKVNIRIKMMQLEIIRKEILGLGTFVYVNSLLGAN